MPNFTVEESTIPAAVGADGWDEYVEMIALRNAVVLEASGTPSAWTAEDLLPSWHNVNMPSRLFVARRDGHIIGRSTYMTDVLSQSAQAFVAVQVLPDERGKGVGSELFERIRELAEQEQRSTLRADTEAPANFSGAVIAPANGFGRMPLADPGVRFALARGFTLAQVERQSTLTLEELNVDVALAAAARKAGSEYRVVLWVGRTPDHLLSDMGALRSKMQTDAPHADLEIDDAPWDEDRVREEDDFSHAAPRRTFTAAAEHIPSGRLVGYNGLWVPDESSAVVDQQDTLVVSEHRGHGLGMLLKLTNIRQLGEVAPGHPSIRTMNAEENWPMIAINEALGFRPVSYSAVWTLKL